MATATAKALLALCALGGCEAERTVPRIEAGSGGVGYWPENSATAVAGVIDTEVDAVELQVSLTSDEVPILHRGAYLEVDRCTHADGRLFGDRVQVAALTADVVAERVLCGGIPDPAFDQAEVVAEPPMPLDALVAALHDAPGALRVRLDISHVYGLTPAPELFAAAVLDVWYADDLPQALVISSDEPEVLAAFDVYGRSTGFDVPTELVLTGDTLATEADRIAGGLDYVTRAEQARADGVWVRDDQADADLIRAAHAAGLTVGVATVDDPLVLDRLVRRGLVDVIRTSFPGDVAGVTP